MSDNEWTQQDGDSENEQRPAEIERDIEATRARMTQNIDELGERLSPQHLKTQAREAIRDAAQSTVSNVGDQARQTGSRLVDMIRDNPIPVMAVGVGVTWLLRQRAQGTVSGDRMARYAYSGPDRRSAMEKPNRARMGRAGEAVGDVRHAASDAAERVGERAGEIRERLGERAEALTDQAQQKTQQMKSNLEQMLEENPLAVAAGAILAGLAVGLLLPGTEREDRMMGSTRDELVDRAQDVAGRAADAAVSAGHEVADTVRSEIAEHAPDVKDVVKQAAANVTQTVKESASRVKDEATEAAKAPRK